MPDAPTISVITPSFNGVTTIHETIESVRSQDYPSVEHLIIDGTIAVLEEYLHLKWISEKDESHYNAMNKGIRCASGEIVTILRGISVRCDCRCQ